jgi:hypothetical protein
MPAREYNRFVNGSWDDLSGMALDELTEKQHLTKPFRVPDYWQVFGAFDWGFSHPWVFGLFAVNEDGDVYLVETVRGRRMRDDQILARITETLTRYGWAPNRLRYTVAGHDCWGEGKHDATPSVAERFATAGLPLTRANIKRVAGLNNLREYIAWMPVQEGEDEREPAFKLMRTPNNLRTFDRLKEMQLDPDHLEDALKVDADQESGEGGDDEYDMVRYAIASRPPRARSGMTVEAPSAWDPAVLAYESDRLRRGLPPAPEPKVRSRNRDLMAESGY